MVTALFALQDYNLRMPIILNTAVGLGGKQGKPEKVFFTLKWLCTKLCYIEVSTLCTDLILTLCIGNILYFLTNFGKFHKMNWKGV